MFVIHAVRLCPAAPLCVTADVTKGGNSLVLICQRTRKVTASPQKGQLETLKGYFLKIVRFPKLNTTNTKMVQQLSVVIPKHFS